MKRTVRLSLVAAVALLGGCASGDCGSSNPAPAAAEPAAKDSYPLSTCVVSGEKLGGMGDFVTVSYEGVDVRLCCPGCRKAFNKDPKRYADMVTAARK